MALNAPPCGGAGGVGTRLDRAADDARPEGFDVDDDVRKFRHAYFRSFSKYRFRTFATLGAITTRQ